MERVIELIQSAGDGAFAVDRLQRIVFWNDACQSILGHAAQEVLGQRCYEVIGGTAAHGCTFCERQCPAIRSRRRRQPVPARDISVRHRNGGRVWVGVSTIHVPSTWCELSVLIHLIRDVTVRKRIESLVSELTGEVAELNSSDASADPQPEPTVSLTNRERQILSEMAMGKTTAEIADTLAISTATVRNHIHHILGKLGVRNRLEAVILSLNSDLL